MTASAVAFDLIAAEPVAASIVPLSLARARHEAARHLNTPYDLTHISIPLAAELERLSKTARP